MMENKDYVRAHHAKLREYKVRPYKEEGEAIGEYAKAMGMSVQGLFLEAVREYMTAHPTEYKYGMRLRGYSPGAQPKGVLRREDDTTGKYHDIIVYDRPLSAEEISNYDLDTITTPAKGEKGQGEKE